MLRRAVRAFLESRAFTVITQSNLGWSIIRLTPRSFRQHFRDTCHSILYTPLALPLSQSQNEPWEHNRPLLSIIVPCYNYGKYIREALWSIRSQTFQDYEVIIVDDESTDHETISVLKKLQDEGVNVQRQEHSGPATALNLGISLAQGKYVCCISADDTIEPTYVEKCLALLESNPGISFAYSLIRTFGSEHRIGLSQPFDLQLLLTYNHVCGSAVVLREAWKVVGGFDESMSAYEDWDFWIRLGEFGFRGKLIPEPLFNWRRHSETFGTKVDQRRPELIAKIEANHSVLFSDPRRIDSVRQNYRDFRVSNPFINLASAKQYAQPEGHYGIKLILVSDPTRSTKQIKEFMMKLKERMVPLISVTVGMKSTLESPTISNINYDLAEFLDSYYWGDFILNLVRTRSIQSVLICNSKLGYELSQSIRANTSAIIMDAIESDEFRKLSLKFDSYLDNHIVFSEESAKWVANVKAYEGFHQKLISPGIGLERLVSLTSQRQ